jgi:hypothetical protein
VASKAAHVTHDATGGLVAGSAAISGEARDETNYVAPTATGGGKTKKSRKRRYQIEIDGEVIEVASLDDGLAVLEDVKAKAEESAKQAIAVASNGGKASVGKIVKRAAQVVKVPEISASPDLRSAVQDMLGVMRANAESALASVEIAARLAKLEYDIERDDEDILMML